MLAEELSGFYLEWAWNDGRDHFPNELFTGDTPASGFLKHSAATHIQNITPKEVGSIIDPSHRAEIKLLQQVSPHALITTNYDTFLERMFADYAPIIGETVLRASYASIGEILKIHGCVSNPSSMVLTDSDYAQFAIKRKHLSAKLLTYFAEHPLLFVGYSASDPNIAMAQ